MVKDLNAAYARAERIQNKTNRRLQVKTFEC
jgi:hypothetical protein